MSTYTLIVKEDTETGDLYLDIPAEMLEEAGWGEGTKLEWFVGLNNTVMLKKCDD